MNHFHKLTTIVLFGSLPACTTMTTRQPDPGHALVDVTPEESETDRIDRVRLVSVNGRRAHGTQMMLKPGITKLRIGFDWPQGGRQHADLRFYAVEGHVYSVQFDVHPPYMNRLTQTTGADDALGDLGEGMAGAGEGAVILAPIVVGLVGASAVARVGNEIREQVKPADHVDIRVVAKNSPMGVVRHVRAYPDGRVDAKPWAAHAQMSAP